MLAYYSVRPNGYCALNFTSYSSVYRIHGIGVEGFAVADNRFYETNKVNAYGEFVVPEGKEIIFIGGRGSIADALDNLGPLKFMFPISLGAQAVYRYFKSGNLLKDNFTVLTIMKANAVAPKDYKTIGTSDVVFAGDLANFDGKIGDRYDPKFHCMEAKELANSLRSKK